MIDEEIRKDSDYGVIKNNLKDLMDEKEITVYALSKSSNTKYEIVKAYYEDELYFYSKFILAKFCYYLDCDISEIIIYEKSETFVK